MKRNLSIGPMIADQPLSLAGLLFLISLFLFPPVSEAQIKQPSRVEFDLDNGWGYFHTVSAREEGLMIFRQTDEKHKENYKWEFHFLDTTLNESWTRFYDLHFNDQYIGWEYELGWVMLLFRNITRPNELRLWEFNVESGDTLTTQINLPFAMNLNQFFLVGNSALFAGSVNYKPVVVLYDLIRGKSKVVPGVYKKDSEIRDLRVNPWNDTFILVSQERTDDRRMTLAVRTFDEWGRMINLTEMEPPGKKSLVDGVSTVFDPYNQYVIGTYSQRRSNYSRGMFIASLQDGEQKFMELHNFGDFENFFAYTKERREKRIKRRIARRKEKGKTLRFNYRLMVHDVVEMEDKLLVLGEAYYPRYSQTNFYTGYMGLPTYHGTDARASPNFDGYKYTHAVIAAFDFDGKLLWDNVFEINDVTSYNLDRFVTFVTAEDDKMVLFYSYENVIRSKIIQGDSVVEGKELEDIRLFFETDESKNTTSRNSGLYNWYDDKFYAFGVQKIKNLKENSVKMNRTVFYINKVTYSTDVFAEGYRMDEDP